MSCHHKPHFTNTMVKNLSCKYCGKKIKRVATKKATIANVLCCILGFIGLGVISFLGPDKMHKIFGVIFHVQYAGFIGVIVLATIFSVGKTFLDIRYAEFVLDDQDE